jgi:WD40 repeat protein
LLRSGDPKSEARFAREIRALGRVDHPNLVKTYTSGSEGDQWFYAMELIEGTDLARVCETLASLSPAEVDETSWQQAVSTACVRSRTSEESLSDQAVAIADRGLKEAAENLAEEELPTRSPVKAIRSSRGHVEQVVEIMRQATEAAHALHESGVVHRDIKPGNIMITEEGSHAVLMDLGLAQLADEAEGRLTRTRQFVGTLRYASPEQVLSVGQLDARSDVYSLGATLWETLALQALFGATEETPTPELMLRIQSTDPPPPSRVNPHVSRDLDCIVLKCLEKDRERRYRSASELSAELGRFLAGEPVRARPIGQFERCWRWARRNSRVAALLLLVAFSLLAGTIASTVLAIVANRRAGELERAKLVVEGANRDLQEANAREQRAGREAEKLALENRKQLARIHVSRGTRLMQENDLCRALPHFVRALELDAGDPQREQIHRVRIGALLAHAPRLLCMVKHEGPVRYASFSHDGRRFITGSDDKTARIWDAMTGAPLSPPLTHESPVQLAVFAPCDKLALTSTSGDSAVWDVVTGKIAHGPARVSAEGFAFTKRGIRVVDYRDGKIQVWDAQRGDSVTTSSIPSHFLFLRRVDLSPDGERLLVIPKRFGQGAVWDLESSKKLFELPIGLDFAAFNSDGTQIVTLRERDLQLWNVESGGPLMDPVTQEYDLEEAVFSSRGQRVVAVVSSAADELNDLFGTNESDGKAFVFGFELDSRDDAHADRVEGLSTTRHASLSEPVASATSAVVTSVARIEERVRTARFSPCGCNVLTVGADNSVRVWDAGTGQPIISPLPHDGAVNHAEFSPEGWRIVTASTDGWVRIWSLGDEPTPRLARDERTLDVSPPAGLAVIRRPSSPTAQIVDAETGIPVSGILEHAAIVSDADFAPDGSRVATASLDGTARVWDSRTGKPVTEPIVHGSEVRDVRFSNDRRRIVTRCWEQVQVWDATTGELVIPIMLSEDEDLPGFGSAWDVDFSPDGQSVLLRHSMTVRVLNASTGASAFGPVTCESMINHAEFSPDSRRLVTANDDATALVWDVSTGSRIGLPLRHDLSVTHAAFNHDGTRIATSSDDGTARIWDAETCGPLVPPMRHRGKVKLARFSPDGALVVTVTKDQAFLWDAATGELLMPALIDASIGGRLEFGPAGRTLYFYQAGSTIWELPVESSSSSELVLAVRGRAGYRLDESGGIAVVPASELCKLWRSADGRSQSCRTWPPEELIHWHRGCYSKCRLERAEVDAMWHLDHLVQLEPREPKHRMELARAYRDGYAVKDAVEAYTEAIGLAPDNLDAYAGRAECLVKLDRQSEAIADYGQLIRLDGDNREWHKRRGELYQEQGAGRIREGHLRLQQSHCR